MAVNHPQFGTFCEICFTGLTPETCATDINGTQWDLCKGDCAKQAGVTETQGTPLGLAITNVLGAYSHIGTHMRTGDIPRLFNRLYRAIDALQTEWDKTIE